MEPHYTCLQEKSTYLQESIDFILAGKYSSVMQTNGTLGLARSAWTIDALLPGGAK
jgi:hypothetical protein